MKERINNALNEIDERLIQEAAQADRLESSAPKILRRILIPVVAAAAAVLCVFALSNRPNNGVDLIEPTLDMSVPEDMIPEKTKVNYTLPDEIELSAISRERAEQVFFGSQYPYLLYVDESWIVFSDGTWGMYIYDLSMEKLTFFADFGELFEDAAGGKARTSPFFWPGCGINVIMVDGEPAFTVGVSFEQEPGKNVFKYFIDAENGTLERFEELSEIVGDSAEIVEYQPERENLYNIAPQFLDSIRVGENRYIGVELYVDSDFEFSECGLRLIMLSEFSIEGDTPARSNEVCPFTDEFFNSLEMKDKDLGVYRLECCHIGFNTADSTYKICNPVLGSGTELCGGSYSVSGNELTLTDGAAGQEFRFTVDGDNLVSVGGEQDKALYEYVYHDYHDKDDIPEDPAELVFRLAYGKNAVDGGSQADKSVPEDMIPEKIGSNIALPDEMELTAPSRERSEQVFFGSEFPYLLYADESRIAFSDGFWGLYIYDSGLDKLTFSADFMEFFEDAAGGDARTSPSYWPGCGIDVFMVDGEPTFTVGVSFEHDDTVFKYFIDTENGTLKRFEELFEIVGEGAEIAEYQPERKDLYKTGLNYYDNIKIGENRYIGMELLYGSDRFEFSEGGLRLIQLSEFRIEEDGVITYPEVCPFTEEYFDSLEMKNKDLGVYRLESCHIGFNTADSTYKLCNPVLGGGPQLSGGSYAVSGNDLTLTDSATGQEFRFTVDGDNLVSVGGEQDKTLYEYIYYASSIPENPAEIVFKLAYGKSAAGSDSEGISAEVAEQVKITAHSLMTAEAEISEMLQKYHKQNEIVYDEAAARELEDNMLVALTSVSGSITAQDGYDDWRNGTHYGIDIGGEAMEGADIYAPLAGTVAYVFDDGWGGGMGKHLILDHGSGLSTVYASLGEITVTEGQTVTQGEVIGSVGSTGISTGSHLHFEIRRDSEISHDAMQRFIKRYTGEIAGEPERYTVSIYDPESAAELTETLSCPLDDEYNAVAEIPEVLGGYPHHTGIDFIAPVGANIYAAQSGEVVFAEWNYGYGYCVMIDHGSGVLTLYAHCSEISAAKGQTVAQGDVIGSTGSTGDVTGALLHFEIRTDDTPDFDEMEKFMERIGSEIKPWVSEAGEAGGTEMI